MHSSSPVCRLGRTTKSAQIGSKCSTINSRALESPGRTMPLTIDPQFQQSLAARYCHGVPPHRPRYLFAFC